MKIKELPLPAYFKQHYSKFPTLTPIQEKAVKAGLLETDANSPNSNSQLICAPTASGKTLIAAMAITNTLSTGKAIYLVPLRALANEKYQEFKALLENTEYKVIISTGDMDSASPNLANYDLLILTTEKLDSLMRHNVTWLNKIKLVVIDEIHLLNDPSRGPTLEVILTILKTRIKPQLIGLSATIGNPKALASWLEAKLVQDNWRPVKLHKGIFMDGEVEMY
jgi:helicase